jgi:hypothetical protein
MQSNKWVILDENEQFLNLVIWNGDLNKWHPPDGAIAILETDFDFLKLSYNQEDK